MHFLFMYYIHCFFTVSFFVFFFFFFQAEDGIRDTSVTGVQTCALPIFAILGRHPEAATDLGRAIELDEGAQRPRLRVTRAASLAQSGEHVLAAAEAQEVAAMANIPPEGLYGCARVLCFCSTGCKDDADL